jgi:glutathione S-transferase
MPGDGRNSSAKRTLYGFWLSPYMALVAHVLKEAGLPFEYERVSPFVGDTLSSRHRARNPLGKIPSLEEPNGLVISESQAICRYLARSHAEAQPFYPSNDPARCAEVDRLGDFLTFSISGPFFNWFVVGAYFPKAFGLKTEEESMTFSKLSMMMVGGSLGRLVQGSDMSPFLLGSEPHVPDFHLFHILELGKTFADMFGMPLLNLLQGDDALNRFHEAMSLRPSTQEILASQADEKPVTQREIFEEFGKASEPMLKQGRVVLRALLGHDV